jgi:hypothetical protein
MREGGDVINIGNPLVRFAAFFAEKDFNAKSAKEEEDREVSFMFFINHLCRLDAFHRMTIS